MIYDFPVRFCLNDFIKSYLNDHDFIESDLNGLVSYADISSSFIVKKYQPIKIDDIISIGIIKVFKDELYDDDDHAIFEVITKFMSFNIIYFKGMFREDNDNFSFYNFDNLVNILENEREKLVQVWKEFNNNNNT